MCGPRLLPCAGVVLDLDFLLRGMWGDGRGIDDDESIRCLADTAEREAVASAAVVVRMSLTTCTAWIMPVGCWFISPDGSLKAQWNMPASEIGRPEGVWKLLDGRIAVADTHYHRIVIFTADLTGEVSHMFGTKGRDRGSSFFRSQ